MICPRVVRLINKKKAFKVLTKIGNSDSYNLTFKIKYTVN